MWRSHRHDRTHEVKSSKNNIAKDIVKNLAKGQTLMGHRNNYFLITKFRFQIYIYNLYAAF